ncbi:superoxide dismutase [Sulfuricella sp. T08]|uniref:superoxide dismutase family protein n=1 Tax=Sulfuricella sp. T08 TaxID=1632857 RepID=UPI0006179B99|nr:superoxide dismutase family protein [Sulfuricella sp. T08]GAO36618.1 superoxide dismutase [Sulfuricella sp. T08]
MSPKLFIYVAIVSAIPLAAAADLVVPMNLVDENGIGNSVGKVTISESKYGLVLTPALNGLSPGLHGFHVHQNPDCGPKEKDGKMVPALAAGGHYDPEKTNRHDTPWGDGHLGDLPPLFVDANGNATQPVLASRLKISDLKGRSLMVHVGGDNHADHPAPLGGGGARMVCGLSQ